MHKVISGEGYKIYYANSDPAIEQIRKDVPGGLKLIEDFLKKEFKNEVKVFVFPSRAALDSSWQIEWGVPDFKSQCWMVGSGIQSKLDLLSPSTWRTDACEHDPEDSQEIRMLIYHELTHVLHSDHNLSPAFDNINNIDWFVEGLATYVSGQLDEQRLADTREFVKTTGGPEELSMFWKGPNRYGLAGSMIAHIDAEYGREKLSEMLKFNDVKDILELIGKSEEQLITEWKKDLMK